MDNGELRLVKLARKGDREAFTQLVVANERMLSRVAMATLKNPDDAADAVQDTVLQAWESLGQLRQPRYFKTWVVRILLNKCYRISAQRSLYAHSQLEETLLAGEQPDWTSLWTWPAPCRPWGSRTGCCWGCSTLTGSPPGEIAQALGLSESCVRQRLHRGRKRFQAIYTEKEELCHEK